MGGRNRVRLQFNDHWRVWKMIYAGIDLGGTSIKGALVTDKGEISERKAFRLARSGVIGRL